MKRKRRGDKRKGLCLPFSGCRAGSKDQAGRARFTDTREEGALLVRRVDHLDLGVPRNHQHADCLQFLDRQESSWACVSIHRSI